MCFSVPYKVIRTKQNMAYLEGGKSVKIGKEIQVKSGEYLQIIGDIAVGKLSKTQGLEIRRLIKSLNN